MTTPATDRRMPPYVGNDVTTAFAYDFYIADDSEIAVIEVDDATTAQTTLVLDTDYTVSGVGDESGGTVTLTSALATGKTLYVIGNTPLTQPTDFKNQSSYQGKRHERALDRLANQIKELDDKALTATDLVTLNYDAGGRDIEDIGAAYVGELYINGELVVPADMAISLPPVQSLEFVIGNLAGTSYETKTAAELDLATVTAIATGNTAAPIVRDTVADMKALTGLAAGTVVILKGRDAVGDCDMPPFIYFADPTTENGVTHYNQTTGGGSFRANTGAVKLQWAGAKLNGVTDDTDAWLACASTGLPLIGWYGRTIINSPVTFSASILGYGADLNQSEIEFTGTGQLIVGDEGAHWTRLRLTSSVNALTLVKNNGVSRWTFDKFIMTGQGLAANQIGVHFNTNASIYQCKVDGVIDDVTYLYLIDNTGAFNNNEIGSGSAYCQNFASAFRLEGSGNFDANKIYGYYESGTNLFSRTAGTMRNNVIDVYLDNVTNAYNSSVALSDPNTWVIDSSQFTQAGTAPTEQVFVGRKHAFSVYLSADQTGVADNTATKISFDTELFDIGGNFDSTTNRRFTAPRAMRLWVYAQADVSQNLADNDRIDLNIYVNGSNVMTARDRSRGTNGSRVQVSGLLNLAKGDYVEIFALADEAAGSGTHTISGGQSVTYFVGHEI